MTAARAEVLQAERDRLEQNFNALSTAALRWEPGRAGALLERLRREEAGDG